mmetsp:Transcript_10186/g.23593  ORF Transcript_10186/g.23593 Transcript_10186/m.23593 type:complete len:289 (+) Transcript_10186:91-957(+)
MHRHPFPCIIRILSHSVECRQIHPTFLFAPLRRKIGTAIRRFVCIEIQDGCIGKSRLQIMAQYRMTLQCHNVTPKHQTAGFQIRITPTFVANLNIIRMDNLESQRNAIHRIHIKYHESIEIIRVAIVSSIHLDRKNQDLALLQISKGPMIVLSLTAGIGIGIIFGYIMLDTGGIGHVAHIKQRDLQADGLSHFIGILSNTQHVIFANRMKVIGKSRDPQFAQDFRIHWICQIQRVKWINQTERHHVPNITKKSHRIDTFRVTKIRHLTHLHHGRFVVTRRQLENRDLA